MVSTAMQIEDQKEGKKILKLANTNEGFASLDTSINGAKGHMFGKALDPPSAHFKKDRLKKLSTRIKTIQDYVMLFDIMKDSDFKQMNDATNNRLYQAFTDIDQSITNCGLRKTNGKPFLAHWASRYRTWMEQYLDDVSPPVWQWVSDTLNDLETKLDSAVAPAIIYGEPLDTTAIERHLKELKWIKSLPEFQRSYFKIDFGLTWRTSMLPRTTVNACPGRPLTTLSTGIRSKTGQDSRSNEPSTSATKSGSIGNIAENHIRTSNFWANRLEYRFSWYIYFRRRSASSVYHRSLPYRNLQQCYQSTEHDMVAYCIKHNISIFHHSCRINNYRCSQLGCT